MIDLEESKKKIAKSALGAENNVEWEQVEDIYKTLQELKEKGFHIASIEQAPDSIDYKSYEPTDKQIIVMGNEVGGVEKQLLDLSDSVLELPMKGAKESLNVATCCGIVLYRLFDV